VKTTSIGSLSDETSDTDSVFSLAYTDLGIGKHQRRKSQASGTDDIKLIFLTSFDLYLGH